MIRIFILFSLSDVEKLLSQSGKIYLSGKSITFTVVKMHHPTCNNPAPSLTKTEVLVSTNSTNSLDFTVYSWAKTQILNFFFWKLLLCFQISRGGLKFFSFKGEGSAPVGA